MLNKLIMVGMRYMRQDDIKSVTAEFKSLGHIPVTLKIEANSEGYNNTALGVFVGTRKVGYIRNKRPS